MLKKGRVGEKRTGDELEGAVERVTFHSEESGFCVLKVKVAGRRGLVTVLGSLPNVVPGEWIQARGEWIVDPKFGRQFKTEELRTTPPESIAGIKKFLGSGLIKGIGPVYAGRLVEKFGKDIFEVIERESAKLERIDGIGTLRRQRIKESWNETREVRAIMAFLLSHGVSTARAFRIHKTYGDEAIRKVQADPYCLARDIRGIGFQTADQVAETLGIEKTSDLRARAGVEYVLLEITRDGHCAYPRPGLISKAQEILDIPDEIIERAIDHGLEGGRLVQELMPEQDDVLVYLVGLHTAELALANQLKMLLRGFHPCPPVDVPKAVEWVEKSIGLALAPAQKEALKMMVSSKVMVMTGGPGVGKTTSYTLNYARRPGVRQSACLKQQVWTLAPFIDYWSLIHGTADFGMMKTIPLLAMYSS